MKTRNDKTRNDKTRNDKTVWRQPEIGEPEELEARLGSFLSRVRPSDRGAMVRAKKRWDSVAKPIGSLGVLEEDIIRIAGMTGDEREIRLEKSALAVMCADHGCVAEGVTQTGQEVTAIVANNFAAGKTSVTIMCETTGTDVFPIDIGMVTPRGGGKELAPFCLADYKIAFGSRNLVREPAMSRGECMAALLVGVEIAGELKSRGYRILAAGEMGIGNTTPSSAIASVLTGLSPEEATGRGAGLSEEGLSKKRAAVGKAVLRYLAAHPKGEREDAVGDSEAARGRAGAVTLLSELGGFDIAGMAGLCIGGAVFRLPVVLDGFISSVAALLAVKICPDVRDYLLASHNSTEPAGGAVMRELGFSAPLHMGMHLGEGSGAVALLPLLRMGADVYERMSSFAEIHVESYVDYEKEGGADG